MNIITHIVNNFEIAEVKEFTIQNVENGLDLVGNVYYQGFDKVMIQKEDITADFFDLKNGMAGEILQKFSNYRVQLTIIGDFSDLTSQSIKDFMYESNQGRQVNFVSSLTEAMNKLSRN